jgi:hypothetical protein
MFDDDLTRKVERCFRYNSEQQFEDHLDQLSPGKQKIGISINKIKHVF